MNSRKLFIIIIVLILAILTSYNMPKAKYTGTGFISDLEIPLSFSGWTGKDVTQEVGLNVSSSRYDFVSEALAYNYINSERENLIFIILDAGNFHHPKNCFIGAGYKIKELDDTEFQINNYSLRAHTLYTERGQDSFLSFYWIVIDKNIAHEWVEQKFKQMYFSLFGKKRVGLMVRIDIPAKEEDIEKATGLARQFISNVDTVLSPKYASYIFGENR